MRHLSRSGRVLGLLTAALMCVVWAGLTEVHAAPADTGPTVLKKGKAPRVQLALKLAVGSKGRATLLNKTSVTGAPGGDVNPPAVTTGLDWKITGGDAKKGWAFEVVAELPPPPPQYADRGMPTSITLEGTVAPDGSQVFKEYKGGEPGFGRFVSMMASEFAKNAIRLPSAPVGVGAKWQVVQKVDLMMMKTTNTTTYELTRMTPGGFAATMTTTVVSDGGAATATGKTTTKLIWGADQLFPPSLVADSKMATTMKMGEETLNMTTTLHLEQTSKLVR